MNLALFVTQESLSTLPALVAEMAEKQQETVNGACVVLHDSNIKPADLSFTLALARRFKTSGSLSVQVNSSLCEASQNASLFSQLLVSAYARYPGPWLIFDEPASPKEKNFMQELLRQHGKYGGRMTGRAVTEPGSARPVGPVTLELEFKILRFLRYPTRQSWRERGQFLFARSGFQLVPANEWLFNMGKVESTQYVSREDFSGEAPDESLTDDELRAKIAMATGTKPHHFTGREKLLSMARELSLAPA